MEQAHERRQRQVRSIPQEFAARSGDTGELVIEGYFAVFNSPYLVFDGAEEVILPGAFAGCLNQDVRALINHDTALVLGRTKAGTLALQEDKTGLFGRIVINPNDRAAMDLYARVSRGDVDQCSFGFEIEAERTDILLDGSVRWSIERVSTLYEVSVCTYPAYEATSCAARRRDFDDIQHRRLDVKKKKLLEKLKGD